MSVIIKNMKVPQYCGACQVGFCKQIGCELYIGFDDYATSRHPDCPISNIPTPHGRLIDADALADNWYYASAALRPDDVKKVVALDDIDRAPTIIEAEASSKRRYNMGVYIKGMEMPTGERPVHIEIHRDGTVIQWKFGESDEIIGTAVEVPPHGRLIDADKLHKATYHRAFETDGDTMWQSGCWVRYQAIEQVQDSQPTIIEAEEET